MQKRVESTRPDAIPVVSQFLHHRLPEDRLMGRVDEHMNPYQAEKEFPLMIRHKLNIPPI